jgi:membrane dipeptidase
MSDQEIDLIAENDGVIHIAPFRAYIKDYSDKKLIADLKAARLSFGITEVYSYPFELYWEIEDPKEKMAFLTTISDIIGPVYVSEFVDHIDYVVNRVGINHVGIGSDFNHGAGITGFNEASDALNVTIELVRRGYSTSDIQKIWSGNFLRVLAQAENNALR